MTSASSMHEAGDSKPVLWDNPRALCLGSRDGVGEKVGGGFRMGDTCAPWLIHVDVWQKSPQYCKVISSN